MSLIRHNKSARGSTITTSGNEPRTFITTTTTTTKSTTTITTTTTIISAMVVCYFLNFNFLQTCIFTW
jgi:hypothetical protein